MRSWHRLRDSHDEIHRVLERVRKKWSTRRPDQMIDAHRRGFTELHRPTLSLEKSSYISCTSHFIRGLETGNHSSILNGRRKQPIPLAVDNHFSPLAYPQL